MPASAWPGILNERQAILISYFLRMALELRSKFAQLKMQPIILDSLKLDSQVALAGELRYRPRSAARRPTKVGAAKMS